MKDEGCAHKDRNALCLLGDGVWSQKEQALSNAEDQRDGRVEGVFAWCRCPLPVLHPLFPLPQLTARPNPSRIVAQSLIYLLQAPGCPIASLPNCCSTQRDPDACTTTCTAMQHLLLNLPLQTGRTAGVVVVAAGAGRPSRCALRRKACPCQPPKCESPHVNCLFQLGQYIETVFVAYHVQPLAAAYHAVCVPEHRIFVQLGCSQGAPLDALTATTASAAQQSSTCLRTDSTTVVHAPARYSLAFTPLSAPVLR